MAQKAKTKIVGATAEKGGQTASLTTTAAKPQPTKTNKTAAVKTDVKTEVKYTDADKILFQQQESIISSNEAAFLQIGQALSLIKAKDLQKVNDPNLSFADYCNRRWGYGDKYSYKLIAAFECISRLKGALTPKGVTAFPTCEAQVRPLTKLDSEKQIEVWAAIVEDADNKTITAATVEEVVANLSGTASDSTPAAEADEEDATVQAKAEHRKLVAIGKLVAKVQEIEPAKLSVEKLKAIVDKIAELLKEDED
jgi:hypothetical protein